MAEKVKVSREVAEFIKSYEENVAGYSGWEDHLLMEHSREFFSGFEGCKEEAKCMKEIPPLQLAEILINGYEIEQTPEEKIVSKLDFVGNPENDFTSEYYGGFADGVIATLNAYNLKVKGINE